MSFLDDLKKAALQAVTGRSYVKSNEEEVQRNVAPLVKKANARNVQRFRSGQINQSQARRQQQNIINNSRVEPKQNFFERNVVDRFSANTDLDKFKRATQFEGSQNRFRDNLAEQIPKVYDPNLVNNYVDSEVEKRRERFGQLQRQNKSGFFRDRFDANSPQDRLNRLAKGTGEVYAPDVAAGESRGLFGQFAYPLLGGIETARRRLGTAIFELGGQVIEQLPGKDNIFDRYGRNVQQFADDYERILDRDLQGSRFATSAREGEIGPLVQVGSGAGSLATSVGIAAATGNPSLAASVFGVSEAGEQAAAAREAGVGGFKSLAIGGVGGLVQYKLEKVGLDKLFKAAGAEKVANRALQGFVTESLQEASQSFSSATISNIYQDVDYGEAFKQALIEGGYGGILGAGGAVSIGAVNTMLNDPKVAQLTKQKITELINKSVPQAPLSEEVQNKRDGLINAFTIAEDQGRPDLADEIARQIDQIDNPAPGSLREAIRNAKNVAVNKYQEATLLPGEPGAPNQIGAVGRDVRPNSLDSLKQEAMSRSKDNPLVIDEETFLARAGYEKGGGSEVALNRQPRASEKQISKAADKNLENITKHQEGRDNAKKVYKELVEQGLIRGQTFQERTIETAQGHPDNSATKAAQRIADKNGWSYNQAQQETKAPVESKGVKGYRSGRVDKLGKDDILGDGLFFGDRKSIAKLYGSNVQEVDLDIKKPYVISEKATSLGGKNQDQVKLVREMGGTKKFRQHLKDNGYDGIKIEKDYGNEYYALDTKQISQAPVESKTLYRSGEIGDGNIFLDTNEKVAKSYQEANTKGGARTTNKYTLDPKANILEATTKQELVEQLTDKAPTSTLEQEKLIKETLEAQGYDGVKYTGYEADKQVLYGNKEATTEYQIFNKNSLSQAPVESKTKLEVKPSKKPYTPISQPVDSIPAVAKVVEKKSELKERGGITTIKESKFTNPSVAGAVSGQYRTKTNDILVSEGRQTIQYDMAKARDIVRNETSDRAVVIAGELVKLHGTKGDTDLAVDLALDYAQTLTKAAKALQAGTLFDKLSPEGMLVYGQRITDGNLKPETADQVTKLAQKAKKMKTGSVEQNMAYHDIKQLIARDAPQSKATQAASLWKAGLLTAWTTTGGNIIGNTGMGIGEQVANVGAVPIDMISKLFTGKRTRAVTFKNGPSGTIEGGAHGVTYFKTGYDQRNDPLTKWDAKQVFFGDSKAGQAAEFYVDKTFKLMGAQDQPFWYAAFRMSLAQQAKVDAINKGLKGKKAQAHRRKLEQEPTTEMLDTANVDARVAVFQNPNVISDIGGGIKREAASRGGATGEVVGEFILPFTGVPGAVANAVVAWSPVGLGGTIGVNIYNKIKHGEIDQRKFTQAMSKGTIGTFGLMGLGAQLAASGLITLGYPTDEDEKALWEAENKMPFSIKLGNRWVSMNYLQPFGTVMAMGGEMQRSLSEGDSPGTAFFQGMAMMGQSITEQSFLQGMSGAMDLLQDPANKGANFLESTVGSIVPNIVRKTAQSTDSFERNPDGVWDAFKAGIPGARQTTPKRLDAFGRPVEQPQIAVGKFLDPTKSRTEGGDELTKELRRLQDSEAPEALRKRLFPPKPSGSTWGIENITEAQENSIKGAIYPEIQERYDEVIKQKSYQSLSDEDKVRKLSKEKDAILKERRAEFKALDDSGRKQYINNATMRHINSNAINEKGFLNMIATNAKAWANNPRDAFKYLGKEKILRTDNGAIVIERPDQSVTDAIRSKRGATTEQKLDHTVPLQLGGDNSEGNLKLVPTDVHKGYNDMENEVARRLRTGQISGPQAKKDILALKNGDITLDKYIGASPGGVERPDFESSTTDAEEPSTTDTTPTQFSTQTLPDTDYPNLPKNSKSQELISNYEAKVADGTYSEIDQLKEKNKLITGVYKSTFDDATSDFYKLGSDAKMRTAIENGLISKAQLAIAIEADNRLTELGIQDYPEIGKGLRADYGFGLPKTSKKSGSSKKSGGSRGSGKTARNQLAASTLRKNTNTLESLKKLDALLRSGGEGSAPKAKKVTVRKPRLKKTVVRA